MITSPTPTIARYAKRPNAYFRNRKGFNTCSIRSSDIWKCAARREHEIK
jgi:hypothetical protein